MSQMTLTHLLAKALEVEFGNMIRADDPSDWQEAAEGVLSKMDAAMATPKNHPIMFTDVEINLLDMQMQAMGWDWQTQSRHQFMVDVEKALVDVRPEGA